MIEAYTLDRERWDLLCLRITGQSTPHLVNKVRRMNPELAKAHAFTLPAGAKVVLPNISVPEVKTVGLAPWQR